MSTDTGIFISYRRADEPYAVAWLYDRLAGHFGREQVFKDVDALKPGDDFAAVIATALSSCAALIAIIGTKWLTCTDSRGHRCLDDPDDFVRLEIETALARGVRVIPVLIDGAALPGTDDLPRGLQRLTGRQFLELSPVRFEAGTLKLLRVLEETVPRMRPDDVQHRLDEAVPLAGTSRTAAFSQGLGEPPDLGGVPGPLTRILPAALSKNPSGRARGFLREANEIKAANAAGRLYGRAGALRLVREFLSRGGITDAVAKDGYRTPVLVFEGPPGTGKTALLAAAAEQLGQEVSCARIDCEDISDDARGLLLASASAFSRRTGRPGTLRFPRLITGLIAVSVHLETLSYPQARDQLCRLLEQYRRSGAALQEMVAGELAAAFPGTLPSAAAGVGTTLGARQLLYGAHMPTSRWRRSLLGEGQEWYAHQDRDLRRDSLDVLVDLNQMASRHGADDRRAVTDLLCAAFLADVRNSTGRKSRPAGCLLLLDNADAPIGRYFLETVLSARRISGTAEPDPLTLIAASRGGLSSWFRSGKQVTLADASYTDYLRREQNGSARWLYPVTLPGLTQDETEQMAAALDLPGNSLRAAAQMIHPFTAGHPRGTLVLLSALARHPESGPDLLALLAQPGEHDNVEETILSDFLRGITREAAEDLVTCSAARHREAALRLEACSGLLTQPSGVYAELFSPEFWQQTTADDHAALHPLLRRLLLRRLSRRDDSALPTWTHVFELLRALSSDSRDNTGTMYYALALGDVQYVATGLERSLDNLDAGRWLQLLRSVTAAPSQLDHQQPLHQQLAALTRWADPGREPISSITQLVATSWISSDPLSASHRQGLYQRMAEHLHTIARHYRGPDDTAFYETGSEYREAAQQYRYPAASH